MIVYDINTFNEETTHKKNLLSIRCIIRLKSKYIKRNAIVVINTIMSIYTGNITDYSGNVN